MTCDAILFDKFLFEKIFSIKKSFALSVTVHSEKFYESAWNCFVIDASLAQTFKIISQFTVANNEVFR